MPVPAQVRPERPDDHPSVFALHRRVFGIEAARRVELIRPAARPLVSLVALRAQDVVGHVLFTPVAVGQRQGLAMLLGPLAVAPEARDQGLGTRLVQVGLDACRISGIQLLFALGSGALFTRLGFRPDSGRSIETAPIAEELLALELSPGALARNPDGLTLLPECRSWP